VTQAFHDATNAGDRDAQLELIADDMEVLSAAARATGVAEIGDGHDGLRQWWAQMDAIGVRPRVYNVTCVEIEGRAFCQYTIANEREGGLPNIASTLWAVVTLAEDGRIASWWSYRSADEALDALERGTAL
jgi:hypothetical protein